MSYYLNISGAVLSIIFNEILVTNRQYTIKLYSGIQGTYESVIYNLDNDYTFSFTSKYCPLFSTVGRVKLQGGPLLDQYTDDTILRMIHKNSLDAVDLYNINNPSYQISYDYFGCTWHDVPITLRRYVECKTAYDLISLIKLYNATTGAANQTKRLGDMSITYGTTNGPASDPNKLKELYDCWQESLRMFRTIKVSVKAIYDSSMGYSHPAMSPRENRVIKPVSRRTSFMTPGTHYYRGF